MAASPPRGFKPADIRSIEREIALKPAAAAEDELNQSAERSPDGAVAPSGATA